MATDYIPLPLTHMFYAMPCDKEGLDQYHLAPAPVPVLSAFFCSYDIWFIIPNEDMIPTMVPADFLTYEGVTTGELMALVSMFADGLIDADELRERYKTLFPQRSIEDDKETDSELSDIRGPEKSSGDQSIH